MSVVDQTAEAVLESFGYKQELKRSLSLFDLLVYGLVFIVPVAPFTIYGIVFNAAKGMVPLVYLVGLVAMIFTAWSYRAMSEAFPVAGSVYTYAARSIGPGTGFLAGWAILLDYFLLPSLNYIACAVAIHSVLPQVPEAVWIVAMVGFSTLVNFFGIEATTKINFVMLGVQLLVLILLVGLSLLALAHHTGGAHWSLKPFYNPAMLTPNLIVGALSLAVLSFLGFDAVSTLSEEVKGGPRMVGRATILSLVLCAFLFILQSYFASLFVLDRTSFAAGLPTYGAFYDIANVIGGPWFKFIVAIPGVVLSGLAGALVAQAATARIVYGMARDGKLPRLLAFVHPVRKVPERAIFLVALVTLAIAIPMMDRLELLTSIVSFGALVGFLTVHASVVTHFILRRKSRDWLRHLVLPAIGFLIIAYVLYDADPNSKIVGVCWLAVGGCILVWFRLTGRSAALQTE